MIKDSVKIEIPNFMTHAQKSKSKYIKINGQRLFVGINHHLRASIMKQMHEYILQYIPKDLDLKSICPITIRLEIHVPINFGDVKMIKDKEGIYKLSWKKPVDGYLPKWDADNLWIWGKAFNDTLVENNFLEDDNVLYVKTSGEVKWIEVEDISDRKLVFIIDKVNV